MRYSIRLAGLLRCCESLEQSARKQRRELDELQGVIQQVNSLWCMDGVAARLRKEKQNLEEEIQVTVTMAQAARRIHQIYFNMEMAIIDAVDCPFRLEPTAGGCGTPIFPVGPQSPIGTESQNGKDGAPQADDTAMDAPGSPVTGGSAGAGSGQAAASSGSGADSGNSEGSNSAAWQANMQLYLLLELYARLLFGQGTGLYRAFLNRARSVLQIEL